MVLNKELLCKDCPNAYYIEENGISSIAGCVGVDVIGRVVANDGEGITAMLTDRGICIYCCDIEYCPHWGVRGD